ncbi:hypothetical protein C0Q44_04645 [Paenibacillus sp. PCH8]|uniref:hypothetical protein n=1 Tax=Paenibacillus sp. PCH8 TaxID=2066524 RepID=UPI000CFA39DE|nr:hypothetical protein [Paenibacillus sp. PCH8]PQP83923.1 hypothetical protein C0Q44_04645 [Paenibacillus sp. PCH8]
MSIFTISVKNQASYSANICLYQVYDELRNPSQVTYVWLSAPSVPHSGTVKFSWDTQMGFWWGNNLTDLTIKNMSIRSGQTVEAALPQLNEITLSRETNGGYLFSNPYPGKVHDSYTIMMDTSVMTEGPVLVGLAQNGYPVTAIEAHPNTRVAFQQQAQLYMTYGFLNTGEIIDPDMHMDYSVKLDFQTHSQLDVAISEKNQFRVTNTSMSKNRL